MKPSHPCLAPSETLIPLLIPLPWRRHQVKPSHPCLVCLGHMQACGRHWPILSFLTNTCFQPLALNGKRMLSRVALAPCFPAWRCMLSHLALHDLSAWHLCLLPCLACRPRSTSGCRRAVWPSHPMGPTLLLGLSLEPFGWCRCEACSAPAKATAVG